MIDNNRLLTQTQHMEAYDTSRVQQKGRAVALESKDRSGEVESGKGQSEAKEVEMQKRFWSKVNKDGPIPDQDNPHYAGLQQCWLWTALHDQNGYGRISITGRIQRAHRTSWMLHFGAIPNWLCVLHKCDNPSCINPQHLFLGTKADNNADMRAKNRNNCSRGERHSAIMKAVAARGDKSPSRLYPGLRRSGDAHFSRTHPELLCRGEARATKLSAKQVLEIRAKWAAKSATGAALAAEYGVSEPHINAIVHRKVWKSI